VATSFQQVNLAVRDIDEAIAVYRLLGLGMPHAHEWPEGSGAHHVDMTMAGGQRFALDDHTMIAIWHPGFLPRGAAGSPVIGLQLDDRAEVDALTERARTAGHDVAVEPYDAFWGSRYALVVDPDGHHGGLRSPVDESARYEPTTPDGQAARSAGRHGVAEW
jgi:uncharacterized glyoxalase superfamily protein PhnB